MSGTAFLILECISWVFILSGTAFLLIGGLGLVRLPEFWSRLHAASIIESGGMILVLLGLAILSGVSGLVNWHLIAFKLIAILAFVFITGPTATHAIANAASVAGLIPPKRYRIPKEEREEG